MDSELNLHALAPDFPRIEADLSFEGGIPSAQGHILKLGLAVIGIGLIAVPISTLFGVAWGLFIVFSLLVFWRGLLVFIALCDRLTAHPRPTRQRAFQDLPVYTVLVPLYHEAAMVPQLATALRQIRWPADRLDIQILLETDDGDTLRAAQTVAFPPNTRFVLIPPGGPRTKPNALNVGLSQALGRYITIYDAEDIPHPGQLHAAHMAFSHGPEALACVQAPLIGRARNGDWLAAQWALEYAVQFGLLLPSMALYRLPLLIGGTSNHFRKSALQALGGWDSYNVTEDADLGMRITRAGMVCGTIDPPTYEDAPRFFKVWLAQRSRWIKGFIQTWLVLMRAPKKTLRQMGVLQFLIMQMSLGGAIITPLFHLPCLLLLGLVCASSELLLGTFGTWLLIAAFSTNLVADLSAPGAWTWQRWVAALTRPVYWPLHSLAAYRAIWELAKAPFFWAKTPHRPRETEETRDCSTGLSASAWPARSSRSESLHTASSARFENPISARINGHGD